MQRRTAPSGKRRRPQNGRRPIQKRGQRQGEVSGVGLSIGEGGGTPDAGSPGFNRADILGKDFKSKSAFVLSDRYSLKHEDLERALPILYKCLLKSGKFIDDKDWDGYPSLPDLADYIFKKIREITPEGFEWLVREDHNFPFEIVYFKALHKLEDVYSFPIEWLPLLKKRNPQLFMLTFDVLSLVAFSCHLDVIFNQYQDMLIDDTAAYMTGEEDEDELLLRDSWKYKKNGIAKEYFDNFTTIRKKDPLKIIQAVRKYKPKTPQQRAIYKMLLQGLEVYKDPAPIGHYSLNYEDPERNDGDPVMPNDYFGYVWSHYDEIFNHGEQWRNDVYHNSGICPPTVYGVITPKMHFQPSTLKALSTLIKFHKLARQVYYQYYDNHFKKFYDKRRAHQAV